ncbi:MAG: pantetheine-phosphate adenylyltransferase [Bacteroidaceae bacterium]|nr:pantetheine-phosphate adenylyltransferase [Bacteroidaceae bacterium]MBR4779523.1 pantetheine-phosphate adenylyltransferase [Bacteroidaceae bacterium]
MKAVFPGTFDPFTVGHYDIVRRALTFTDEIIIAVGVNELKNTLTELDERLATIRELYANEPRVSVAAYDGLTTDFARSVGARFILRGVRSISDFEYERNMADINRHLTGIETVLLFSSPELAYVSSSMVRELIHLGKPVDEFLPQ